MPVTCLGSVTTVAIPGNDGRPSVGAEPFALAEEAGAELARRLGAAPEVAVVLGSGWKAAADALGDPETAFPMTVSRLPRTDGRRPRGELWSFRLGGRKVLVLAGRARSSMRAAPPPRWCTPCARS